MKSHLIYLSIFALGYLTSTFISSFDDERKKSLSSHPAETHIIVPDSASIKQNPIEQAKHSEIFVNCQNQEIPAGSLSSLQQKLPESPDINQELTELREYRANNEIAKHQDYLKEIGATNNISQSLADQFMKESVDPVWSMESKNTLDNFINNKNHLSTLPNVSTECKSQQCKISILSTDPHHLSSIDESLNQLITEGKSFSNYTTVVDEKTNTTSVYIGTEPSSI